MTTGKRGRPTMRLLRTLSWLSGLLCLLLVLGVGAGLGLSTADAQSSAPTPFLAKDRPVDWWFVFKLNATFPDCGGDARTCPFGGTVQKYKSKVGQQWVFASSEQSALKQGTGCAGETPNDPIGATFGEVLRGRLQLHHLERPVLPGPGALREQRQLFGGPQQGDARLERRG